MPRNRETSLILRRKGINANVTSSRTPGRTGAARGANFEAVTVLVSTHVTNKAFLATQTGTETPDDVAEHVKVDASRRVKKEPLCIQRILVIANGYDCTISTQIQSTSSSAIRAELSWIIRPSTLNLGSTYKPNYIFPFNNSSVARQPALHETNIKNLDTNV
ncbi:hypothetical protein ONZ51_g5983 [Trametes cubensis]|uniref:Uncharacterized protein n=1 Tax=Trametes cubensis TaxID=1111947 RepID=A0AAD7TU40_9APHY|nr:hypothetical protein ONZ51_g5983 [Trametes cubensis]